MESDLRQLVQGEVYFDKMTRAMYSTDASTYEIEPIGIIRPKNEEDVMNVVKYAYKNRIPIIPRGGGSSISGASAEQSSSIFPNI